MLNQSAPKRSRSLGCWIKPLILAILCLGLGTWMLDSWATLSGPGKASAIILISFGSLLFVPLLIALVFVLWFRRLKKTLEKEVGCLGHAFEKLAENNKRLYETPPEYRPATPEDFASVDTAFYDDSERIFAEKGFRKLGDIFPQSLADLGQASPPMRVLVSSGGTIIVACYHLQASSQSLKIIDLQTEFSDGTFLATANTAGLDLSTPPPQLERRQFVPDSPIPALIDAHQIEFEKLISARPNRTCLLVQTLGEAIDQSIRLHAVKQAFQAQSSYLDDSMVRRVSENQSNFDQQNPRVS